jgi:hypothetical protein
MKQRPPLDQEQQEKQQQEWHRQDETAQKADTKVKASFGDADLRGGRASDREREKGRGDQDPASV